MDKRSAIVVTALFGIIVAACSVEAAPRTSRSASQDDLARQEAPAATPAPGDPYFYGWPGGVQAPAASAAPGDPYFYGWPGGVQSAPAAKRAPAIVALPPTTGPADDYFYGTSRVDVGAPTRTPAFIQPTGPSEDYQSLHATFNHLAR